MTADQYITNARNLLVEVLAGQSLPKALHERIEKHLWDADSFAAAARIASGSLVNFVRKLSLGETE